MTLFVLGEFSVMGLSVFKYYILPLHPKPHYAPYLFCFDTKHESLYIATLQVFDRYL